MKKINIILIFAIMFFTSCKKFEEWGATSNIPMGNKQSISTFSSTNNITTFNYGFSNVSKVESISLYLIKYKYGVLNGSENKGTVVLDSYEFITDLNLPSENDKIENFSIGKDKMFFYVKSGTNFDIDQTSAFKSGASFDVLYVIKNKEGYKPDSIKVGNKVVN